MSRGIKDLRELICVSRLTVRVSDDEVVSDEDELQLSQFVEHVSISVANSRHSSATSFRTGVAQKSPDSGVGVNESPQDFHDSSTLTNDDVIKSDPKPEATKKKRRKKVKASSNVNRISKLHGSGELPRPQPLPPVSSGINFSVRSSSSSGEDGTVLVPGKINVKRKMLSRTDFDDMLTYLDASMTSEWLNRCNTVVADMTQWCHQLDNFVQFAHFWLSEFPELQRIEILKLEYSIVVDQLEFAFEAGIRNGQLSKKDISQLLTAVFPEYSSKMQTPKGFFMFLDYLDVLTCEDKVRYRKLLSEVKCSTHIKQHAEWLLAVRALALVNIWSAVVNFFRRLSSETYRKVDFQIPLSTIAKTNPQPDRMYHAIRNGFVDVVDYLLKSKKVSPDYCDSHQRSLVFTAVMHSQPEVLRYLIKKVKPPPDVNKPADTGNSPLHAAANNDDVLLVAKLLQAEGIDINPRNSLCDGATPLHLAVMHGHKNVVDVLLVAKADRSLKMADQTAEDIAEAFGHEEILTVLRNPDDILSTTNEQ